MTTAATPSMIAPGPDEAAPRRAAIDVGPISVQATGVSISVSELVCALKTLAPGRVVRIGTSLGPDRRVHGLRHLTWLQTRADEDARAAGASLVHYTNSVAPLRRGTPFVLTIADLSLLRRPGEHPVGRLTLAPFIVSAARQARLVIVPSRATGLEVRRLLHVPADRLVVIPLAARTGLTGRSIGVDAAAVTLRRFGLQPRRFVLSLGTIEPRKNHVRLLAAFEQVAARNPELRLVFAGRWGWRVSAFRRALAASPVRDRVVVAGHLPDSQVADLLGSCSLVAYPSLYEGFGLPIVEAMAAGAPVVTSTVSALPETAGGAAVLIDPHDVASIASGIVEAMDRREELVAAGHARVAGRSWLDVGRETLDAYRRAQDADG